jgi:nucleoid-associated protein YgaU
MNTFNFIIACFIISCTCITHLDAQIQTKDEWQHAMTQAATTRDNLKSQVASLEKEVFSMRHRDAALTSDLRRCQDELLSLLGRNESQQKDFIALLEQIDIRLNALAQRTDNNFLSRRSELDSLQALITKTKAQPLALIPEYLSRLEDQQRRLEMLRSSIREPEKQHTVYIVGTWKHDRDCLWNIAGKPKVYGNPFLWPKIWQENRSVIKDPDVIHTGQRLTIPLKTPLTHQEKIAEGMYWKEKRQRPQSLSLSK